MDCPVTQHNNRSRTQSACDLHKNTGLNQSYISRCRVPFGVGVLRTPTLRTPSKDTRKQTSNVATLKGCLFSNVFFPTAQEKDRPQNRPDYFLIFQLSQNKNMDGWVRFGAPLQRGCCNEKFWFSSTCFLSQVRCDFAVLSLLRC